ncbi:MAG: hypothetical protein ACRDL4_04285 [Thermoleophilaceae bacterium]
MATPRFQRGDLYARPVVGGREQRDTFWARLVRADGRRHRARGRAGDRASGRRAARLRDRLGASEEEIESLDQAASVLRSRSDTLRSRNNRLRRRVRRLERRNRDLRQALTRARGR